MEDRIKQRYSVASYLLLGWLLAFLGWWFFALAPLPASSPGWIEAARMVCFGSLPSGLPEGYGWLMLICSPLMMLTALVIIWPKELGQDLRQAQTSSLGRLLLVGLVVLPVISLAWGVKRVMDVQEAYNQAVAPNLLGEPLPETYPRCPKLATDFELVNQRQENISLASLRGHPFILTFAFAHCASICPGLVKTVTDGVNTYDGERPALVIVTLDPWRDTPAALPTLARQWSLSDADHVLSGPVEQVTGVIEDYEIESTRNPENGDVVHPGMAFVFDSEGRLVYQFNDPSVQWLHDALDRL
jgi:cytochrome oxidase Cu insertion factor (SCO1/SenC/PrrC family)